MLRIYNDLNPSCALKWGRSIKKRAHATKYVFTIVALVFMTHVVQAQDWLWAVKAGSNRADDARALAIDHEGNLLLAATIGASGSEGSVFGDTLLSGNFAGNFVLAKYDSCSNLIWARNPGPGEFYPSSISLDQDGGIYILGLAVGGLIDFGNGITFNGGSMGVLLKFDADGSALWITSFEGGSLHAGDLVVDAFQGVYICGHFRSTADFTDTTLSSSGFQDVFLAKYDSLGGFAWAIRGGGNSGDFGYALAIDSEGSLYLAGQTESQSFEIDSIAVTQSGNSSSDAFLAKLSGNGQVLWVRRAQSPIGYSNIWNLAVDADDGIYAVGEYLSNMTLGTDTLVSPGQNSFLAKYDRMGEYQWTRDFRTGFVAGDIWVAADTGNGVYVTRAFKDSVDLGLYSLYANGAEDLMIVKYDTSGQLLFTETVGDTVSAVVPGALAVSPSGKLYITGLFINSVSFGNTQLTASALLGEPQDIFFATYGTCQKPEAQLALPTSSICEGDSILVLANQDGCLSYQWLWNGDLIAGMDQSSLVVRDSGIYSVIVSEWGCIDTSEAASIQILARPEPPQISLVGTDTLKVDIEAIEYHWFLNGVRLPDSTQMIEVTQSGTYSAIIGNGLCFSDTSSALEYISTGITTSIAVNEFRIIPNPCSGSFIIESSNPDRAQAYSLSIVDLQGRIIYKGKQFSDNINLSLEGIDPGLYVVFVSGRNIQWIEKLRIE